MNTVIVSGNIKRINYFQWTVSLSIFTIINFKRSFPVLLVNKRIGNLHGKERNFIFKEININFQFAIMYSVVVATCKKFQ
jgi:hypothetical protein